MARRGQTVYVIIRMFYYDPQKVSEFLDNVARGFITSPLQYALFAGVLLLLAACLLTAYRVQRAKARRLEARLALERYERLVLKLGLTAAELELVGRLAGPRGDPKSRLHLLSSSSAFNRAAGRLGEREAASPGEASLAELRLKLGIQARNPERVPAASSELPQGLPVLLTWSSARGERRLLAEVSAQEAGALVLAPREGSDPPPAGDPLTVLFQNRAGLFSFATRVLAIKGGFLRLEHVERLRRTQRRRYYRRRLQLPVEVQAREGEPPLGSQLLDLGGEGASLQNPQKRVSAGDLIELRFRVGGESFVLAAEVLRLSRDAQVLHVRFPGLRESVRDRLLGVLFQSLGEAAR